MDKISTFGYLKCEETLKNEFKKFETKENNKKIQRELKKN